jgi:hypothetical protein
MAQMRKTMLSNTLPGVTPRLTQRIVTPSRRTPPSREMNVFFQERVTGAERRNVMGSNPT